MQRPHVCQRPLIKLFVAILSTALAVSFSNSAWANGRPPAVTGIAQASQLSAAQTSNTILIGLTFGAAVSTDSGQSFQWTCENALGGPISIDAVVSAPNANTLLVGSVFGLRKSSDAGCTWTPAQDLNGLQIEAIAPAETTTQSWYVAANSAGGGVGSLWRTTDNGQSYTQLPVNYTGQYFYGVAASPINPNTIVVSAGNNGNGNSCLLLVSHDNGNSWSESIVPGAPAASVTPRVTLSPTDASRIVLSVLDAASGGTSILLSTDGGATFTQTASIPEAVRNVEFSPDGTKAFIGGQTRLYRSSDAAASWQQLTVPSGNACAMVDGGRLYACGDKGVDGFSLGLSNDWGNTWDSLFSLTSLQGPYRCPTGTPTRDICMTEWTNEAAVIGANAGPPPATSAPETSTIKGGCHCATLGERPIGPRDALCAGLLVGLAVWRRRRRQA